MKLTRRVGLSVNRGSARWEKSGLRVRGEMEMGHAGQGVDGPKVRVSAQQRLNLPFFESLLLISNLAFAFKFDSQIAHKLYCTIKSTNYEDIYIYIYNFSYISYPFFVFHIQTLIFNLGFNSISLLLYFD